MNEIAEKGSLTTESAEVPMGSDEGMSEHTVFAIPKGTNIVAVCRTQYGVRAEGIARYLAAFIKHHPELEASIIQTDDPVVRAKALRRAKKLTFKISKAEAAQFPTKGLLGVLAKLGSLASIGGNTIAVEISVGRAKELELDRAETMSVIEGLNGNDAVDQLCLIGEDPDGKVDEIDFLTNRLVQEIVMPLQDGVRGPDVKARATAVSLAIVKKTGYLKQFVRIPN